MEDMDIDQVVEIPDTPDRFTLSHVTARNWHPRGRNLSLGGRLRSFGSTDEECSELVRNGSRVGDENGHDSRLQCRPSRASINIDDSRSARNLMPENPHASRNGHLFRRPVMGRNNKIEDTINARALNMDKGKNLCIEVPYNSPSAKDNAFVDLCSPDGRNEMAFPSNLSNGIGDESRKGKVATSGTSSLQSSPNSPKISRKGKEKVADCSSRGSGPAMDRGKQSSHICNSPRMREIFMPPPPSGVGGRKRLVRNGCISPHNIAIRARQEAECNRKSSRSVDENDTINEIPDNTSYPVDISELVSEDKDGDGADRRENALQPSNTRERDRMPSRSNGGSGCVMDEHNQIRIEQADISNGISHMNRAHSGGRAAPGASWRAFGSDRVSGPSHTANTVIKRQKKHGANNRNHAESSTSVHEDSEIGCIDESGVSENARTSAMHTRQNQSLLHPIIEIDDSPPVMTHSERQDIGCVDDDDTVARRRQIEADEMLARELQEQLYYEEPASLSGPVDEFLAMALQQEESPEQEETIMAAFRGRQPVPRSRAPMIVHSRRRPPSVPFQSTSYRRGTQPRGPSSSRMTQLRNRARRQPPAFPRGGNLEFPFDMDLDMRIDMLEALEAAAGDLGDTRLDNRILQFQHDFNENDYEMLLALDENNHNVGVSASQLNTLPLSTVQTDNFDETCAICLETPSAGETIRHLPCLHKFHKDCIDPWISRKSSCPVCKFSIT